MNCIWQHLARVVLVVTLLLSGNLVVATPTAYGSVSQQSEQTYAQAKKQLDDLFKQITALRKLIDHTQFDLDALGFALGGDPDRIIDFVKNEIAFEQYPGLLRGAQGTLISRAGNALDQALLLQQLLLNAGYEVRIKRGILTEEDAYRLLQQMFRPRSAQPAISHAVIDQNLKKFNDLLQKIAKEIELSDEDATAWQNLATPMLPITNSLLYQQSQANADQLAELLTTANVSLASENSQNSQPLEMLRNEARDYFWVTYRLTQSQEWQSVYPIFPPEQRPTLVATEQYANVDEIPASLQQQVQVHLLIERVVDGTLEERSILPPLLYPTTALIGKSHAFTIMGDGIDSAKELDEADQERLKSKYFFPLIDGVLPSNALFFDLAGDVVSADQAQSPFAGLAQGTQGALGDAAALLDTTADGTNLDANQPQLSAVYVDYQIISPQVLLSSTTASTTTEPITEPITQTHRRVLVDRLNPQDRADGRYRIESTDLASFLDTLLARYVITATPGRYNQAYLLNQLLTHLFNIRPILELSLKSIYKEVTIEEIVNKSQNSLQYVWPGFLSLYPLFDVGADALGQAAANAPIAVYRPTPSLVVYRQQQNEQGLLSAVDIVNNQRRAYRWQEAQLQSAPDVLFRVGVWESYSEGTLLSSNGEQPRYESSTATLFAQAQNEAIPLRTLTHADLADLPKLPVPVRAQALIAQALAAQQVIILPEAMPTASRYFGWWQVEPRSGQTVGMMENGTGGTIVEYAYLSMISYAVCTGIAMRDSDGLTSRDQLICALTAVGGAAALPANMTAKALFIYMAATAAAGAGASNNPNVFGP